MDGRVIDALRAALKKAGFQNSTDHVTPSPRFIPYGAFRLADNPALAARLCDAVAERTGCYWTHTAFKRLQNSTPERPTEPDPDSPEWWPAPNAPLPPALVAKHGPAKARKLVAAYNLSQAKNAHETALKDYQELSVQIRAIRAAADFDDRGYMVAFCNALAVDHAAFVDSFFFAPTTLHISRKARQKHTFICAGSGGGKSETIKHIVRWQMKHEPEAAIVVLDPHNDLALDIARFRENATNDRLVYIQPHLFKSRFPAFNPFDFLTSEADEDRLNVAQIRFLEALEIIVGEKFTKAQRALLTPCLGVLLHKEGATFADLVTFMNDDINRELVNYGATNLPNEDDRAFFKTQFFGQNFEATKPALRYRFYELVRNPIIKRFLCSPSTFNLDEALDARKIICFGFDSEIVDADAITTIGQLVNAYLVSFAMGRPKGAARYPIHLYNDECHYFVTRSVKKMLKETRKFGLHLTMATQDINDLGQEIRKAILSNVGCYLIGKNKADSVRIMAEEMPLLKADDIRELAELNFFQIDLDRDPVKTKISYIGNSHALEGEDWLKLMLAQGRAYYQSDRPTPPTEHNGRPDIQSANQARIPQPLSRPMFDGPDFTKNTK